MSKNITKNYYVQTESQYKMRLSEELRDKIKQSAKEHNRTMNADIVARLEQSFEKPMSQLTTLFSPQELEEITNLAGLMYLKTLNKLTQDMPEEQAKDEIYRLVKDMANQS